VRADLRESHAARRGLRALPIWWRAVVWAINPHPILRSLAQSFANRIHQDIAAFLLQFVMVAQAVIEEITLPIHAMFSGDELLPVLDGRCHSRFARERHDSMQMIRHEDAETAMPDESFVIESDRGEHGIASVCAAQLVLARRHAVNGDKEPATLGHPLRNCVRQFRADGQIHACKLITRLRRRKRKKVGRAVLCTPSGIPTARTGVRALPKTTALTGVIALPTRPNQLRA